MGGGGRPNGEENGMPSSPHGPPAARSDGHNNLDKGEGRARGRKRNPKTYTAKIGARARGVQA